MSSQLLKELKLYTTSGCHLCEQAEAMFEYLKQNDQQIREQFVLIPIEIANHDALIEQYGIRIPVIANDVSEIGWPFELEDLKAWLFKNN